MVEMGLQIEPLDTKIRNAPNATPTRTAKWNWIPRLPAANAITTKQLKARHAETLSRSTQLLSALVVEAWQLLQRLRELVRKQYF
jgi:hypothetical protein